MEFYYGVDMGGTTIKMGSFDREGTLLEKWEIPTRKEDGGKHIFDDIAAAILTLSLIHICIMVLHQSLLSTSTIRPFSTGT